MRFLVLVAVLLNLFISFACGYELLLDFLEFPVKFPKVQISEKCKESLEHLNLGIKSGDEWVVRVRDASGKSSSGFVSGNNFWLGHQHNCNLLKNPRKMKFISSSKVPIDYRMFYASHTSPIQFRSETFELLGLHVGLCFPSDCGESETREMAEFIFQSKEFHQPKRYGNITFSATRKLELRESFFNDPFTKILM